MCSLPASRLVYLPISWSSYQQRGQPCADRRNQFVPSKANETFQVLGVVSQDVIANVHTAGPEDVDAAVDAAAAAFPDWRAKKSTERAALMLRLADLMEANLESLIKAEAEVMGMPIAFARIFLQAAVIPTWRYYAGWADKVVGESYPADGDGLYKVVQYEPLGVCGAISAWNSTPLSIAWKVAPAIAVGNTVVHKSSEKSPLGALVLGKLIVEAGFPPGVINLISGAGATGALISSHMKVAKVAFTGSTAAGKQVQEAAAKSNLKRVTLELGGKSPSIVFPDADLENALTHNSQSFLVNSGQACTAGSRVFVHEGIADKFVEQLKSRFEQFAATLGDPMNPNTFLGPVVDKKQFNHIMDLVASGKAAGGNTLAGGTDAQSKDNWVKPTIFLNPGQDNPIYRQEIFGPVLSVNTFKTEEEVIRLANDTNYGLSCTFVSFLCVLLVLCAKTCGWPCHHGVN